MLGATTVTSTAGSLVSGDLGVSPGTAVTGFGPGVIVNGSLHPGDPVATQAQADLATAYLDASGRPATSLISGVLDGLTLSPGVYAAGAGVSLAGSLTLDALDDPDAVFVLQAGSTLGTAAGSHVDLAGGAQSCHVFWQVGSSATLTGETRTVHAIVGRGASTTSAAAARATASPWPPASRRSTARRPPPARAAR